MSDLLLELFSEEIPARMQQGALEHLQKTLEAKLGKPAKGFVTPRRLAVALSDLPAKQPDVDTELKGPKIDAPQQAIDGFLKKSSMKLSQLEKRDGMYVAKIHRKGEKTIDVLKPMIEEILASFPWPKSMRWGNGSATWVRPLHGILCIFDGKVVPVEFAGVKAGHETHGHRFLAPKPISIKKAGEYEAALEKAHVIADRDKRKVEIKKQAEALASKHGLTIKDDPGLLEEVVGLVEWPVLLVGKIDAQFMDLPPEVLTTVMRSHQKYFALTDKAGRLAPQFLITANMETKDGGKAIVAGNERVLRARFSDARFFWDQDRKKSLGEWAEGLKDVTFHAKLGSIADKAERIRELAVKLTDYADANRKLVAHAAELCKADLTSGMVGEFAELQGIMGSYYALHQKESAEVADAIRDHYLPLGPSSPVPNKPVSICLALADKLDTLVSMFAIGEKPTGSKDPFALRRAALGVIRIVLENNLRLPLAACFGAPAKDIAMRQAHETLARKAEASLQEPASAHKVGKYLTLNESAYADLGDVVPSDLADTLLAFFHDRLIVQMKDSGIRHDVIKSVVAGGDDDLVRIVARAKAVQAFLDSDDGKNLLAGYKRAANIVAIEEKKDQTSYNAPVDRDLLAEPPEAELARDLEGNRIRIERLFKEEKFGEMMTLLSDLRGPVDRFFDKIMVNCEDRNLRANRLRLLSGIKNSMDAIADFSAIEGDSKEQRKAA